MADKKKKTLKSYTTAAGSQQAGSDADIKKLVVRLNKDIDKIVDGSMTHAEFKKKYGKSVAMTQKLIYSMSAASGAKRHRKESKTGYSGAARMLDDYVKLKSRETKELKSKNKTDRKFKPHPMGIRSADYRKGGMTLSTVDNRKNK